MGFTAFIRNSGQRNQNMPVAYLITLFLLVVLIVTYPVNFLLLALENYFPMVHPWIVFVAYTIPFAITLWLTMLWWDIRRFQVQKVSLVLFLILIPAILGLSVLAEALVSVIPMPDWIAEMFSQMVTFDIPGYLVVGISAPILEELIFRGVILNSFLKRFTTVKAILWSSVFFGVAHLNPWQFIAAFLIGAVIGWLYWKTQSIWPGIFIHWLNNTFGFVVGYFYNDVNTSFYDLAGSPMRYALLLFASLIVCSLSYWAIKRIFEKSDNLTA